MKQGLVLWLCAAASATLAAGACTGATSVARDGGSNRDVGGGTGAPAGAGGMTGSGGRAGLGGGRGAGGAGGVRQDGGAGASGIDSGGSDAGGGSLCTPGRYIVCEGFEGTGVGNNVVPAGWTRTGAVDVVADAANVYRGAHAMRIEAAANGPRRMNLSGAPVAALGGAHWGRVFYKVQTPAPRPTTGVIHSTMVAGSAVSPVAGNIEVRVVDTVEDTTGHHQFIYNVQPNGGRAEFGTGSGYNWTYDGNWHCAEWHVEYATQSYHFYFDGAEIASIAINNGAGNFTGAEIPMMFDSISVGWNNYQFATPGFVAWFDEIALDLNRIGCAN